MDAAGGSCDSQHLLPLAMLLEDGAGWTERHFWLEGQNVGRPRRYCSWQGLTSALNPAQAPLEGGPHGSAAPRWLLCEGQPGRAPGPSLSYLSLMLRAAAGPAQKPSETQPASPAAKRLSFSLTHFNFQFRSCSVLSLQM